MLDCMNTTRLSRWMLAAALVLSFSAAGCDGDPSARPDGQAKGPKPGESKKVTVGKNVFLEVHGDKRRVLVSSTVCLRKGSLELFLCRKQTKEHEAILSADVDARDIRAALTIAGGKPGATVKYRPEFKAAHGSKVKVTLQYEQKGKLVSMPAQQWVKNGRTGKDLEFDWVFAGSGFVPNPFDKTKPDHFLANDGDLICISNFESALLDLPFNSPQEDANLEFEANSDRIPDLDTKVVVILEPVPEEKKK